MSLSPISHLHQDRCSIVLPWKDVLDNIARNGFINDRSTKLVCRLVCREWRVHNAFSDTITSVTLHSLTSVQQLIDYFPSVPCIRRCWKSIEECRIFSSLRKICIPNNACDLGSQLMTFPGLDSFKAACSQLDISVELLDFEKLEAQLPLYTSLNNVVSLKVGHVVHNRATPLNIYAFFESMFSLSKVTQLVLLGVRENYYVANKIMSLTKLESLRHLEIWILCEELRSLSRLSGIVNALASLTQLTHLDLTLDISLGGLELVDLPGIEDMLQEFRAHQTLARCRLLNMESVHQNNDSYLPDSRVYVHEASFVAGKLCEFSIK